MSNRREFILNTAAASGALALTRTRLATADAKASKPLRILVLGGTGHIGTPLVREAADRGHRVSVFVFTGEKQPPQLPAGVEGLPGDRNGDLQSIKNRDWDAVIDIPTLVPTWVRSLGEALQGRVKHYTLISSVAAYDNRATAEDGADENSKLMEYGRPADPYTLAAPKDMYEYRTLKTLCEREAERQFPGKTLIIRPTVISGPRDNIGGLTYLCARMAEGGEMLVAGDPLVPVQLIDVRDMTEWMIRMVEAGETGPFNAAGPASTMGWAEMLGAVRGALGAPVKLAWVPLPWINEQKIQWGIPAYWPTSVGIPGMMRMSNDKARAKGLTFRPLAVSAIDTLNWFNGFSAAERQSRRLNGVTLAESMRIERELLAAWRARNSR